jgi:outer membrane cobalamin receptor
MRHLKIILFIIFCVTICATAPAAAGSVYADSTQADSSHTAGQDTTIRPRIPLPAVGSIDRSLSGMPQVTDSSIRFIDYQNFADLLLPLGGFSVQELGSPGQSRQLFSNGLTGNAVRMMADGVPLNDSYDGLFNFYFMPTEHIDRVEIVRGTEAFVYGLNSTGAVVNVLTTSRRAVRPFSRLRYSENAYGQAFVDGMVSQDIVRGLNVTAGVTHNTYAGRFLNSNYDQWNARVKARYNISNSLDVIFSENYNQTFLGLYGGIDPAATPESLLYNQFQAQIANSETYEKNTRHDVAGIIAGRLPGDSAGISTMTISYSSQLREYRQEPRVSYATHVIHDDQYSRMLGLRLDHQRTFGAHSLMFGGELRVDRYNDILSRTARSLFAVSRITPVDSLRLTLSARYDAYNGEQALAYGPSVSYRLSKMLEFFGGYSRSYRFATIEEQTVATDSLYSVVNHAPERHHFVEAGLRLSLQENMSLELRAYQRTIRNYITVAGAPTNDNAAALAFQNRDRRLLRGCTADFSGRFHSFVLEGGAGYINTVDLFDTILTAPEWNFNGGIYFWDSLLNNHLTIKTGFHLRAFSSYLGETFLPEYLIYVPHPNEKPIPATSIVDATLLAHVGDAYIHIVLQNIFDTQYVMSTFYPMLDRSLRFGFSWNFLN